MPLPPHEGALFLPLHVQSDGGGAWREAILLPWPAPASLGLLAVPRRGKVHRDSQTAASAFLSWPRVCVCRGRLPHVGQREVVLEVPVSPFHRPLLGRDGVCPGGGKAGGPGRRWKGGAALAGGLGILWHLQAEPGCWGAGERPRGAAAAPTRHPLAGLGPAPVSRGLGDSGTGSVPRCPTEGRSVPPWLSRWPWRGAALGELWAALPLPSGEGASLPLAIGHLAVSNTPPFSPLFTSRWQ